MYLYLLETIQKRGKTDNAEKDIRSKSLCGMAPSVLAEELALGTQMAHTYQWGERRLCRHRRRQVDRCDGRTCGSSFFTDSYFTSV